MNRREVVDVLFRKESTGKMSGIGEMDDYLKHLRCDGIVGILAVASFVTGAAIWLLCRG